MVASAAIVEQWGRPRSRGERGGHYMATADLGKDSRDVGVGDTAQEAVQEALRSLGEPYASEMAAKAASTRGGPSGP